MALIGLLPATSGIAAQNSSLEADEVKRINKQIQARDAEKLKALKAAIQKAQANLKSSSSALSRNETALRAVEKSVDAKIVALRALDAKLKQTRSELDSLQTTGEQLQDDLEAGRSRIEALLRAAHRAGQVPALAMLLGSEDPTSAQRKLTYLSYYSTAEREKLLAYRDQLDALQQNRDAVESAAARLEATRAQLAGERLELEREQQRREQLVASLRKEVGGEQSRLARLEADQKSLSALVKEMNETLARIDLAYEAEDFAKRKGALRWPLDDAALASIGARTGSKGSAWKLPAFRTSLREGNGLFISLPPSSPVHSVHQGRIVFADWLRGFGLLLIIDHGDGFMTLYGNNQALYAHTGDQVRSGDIVASSGSSGGRPEAGLYFEIRKDGRPQNPLPWLR
ncbi:murein hydrolase activator EnvC family protein [Allohahella marinimesophila]